ncbi:hypothetical protein MOUN0_N10374 [Monosporozyma unispora]
MFIIWNGNTIVRFDIDRSFMGIHKKVRTTMKDQTVEEYTQLLVARYLKEHGYKESLAGFLKETSLSNTALMDDESLNRDKSDDLMTIIKERIEFNEYNVERQLDNLNLNNLDNDEINLKKFGIKQWNHDIRWTPVNNTATKVLSLGSKFMNHDNDIAISMANRQFLIYDNKLQDIKETINMPSVIKLFGSVGNPSSNINYACTMDGSLYIFSDYKNILKHVFKLHERMVTHIQFIITNKYANEFSIVSTGLDQMLKLSSLKFDSVSQNTTVNEIDSIKLNSSCSSMTCQYLNKNLSIFLTRNDFTQISCYSVDRDTQKLFHKYYIALNNAQFSTHSFNVRDMILINDKTLAVATSHIPYLRVILVEIPSEHAEEDLKNSLTDVKTYYDKILLNIATQISNTALSQPIIKYLPLSNGLLIGNDNGLYAMDLFKYESWSLQDKLNFPVNTIIKNIDILSSEREIICTFADKSTYLWTIQ